MNDSGSVVVAKITDMTGAEEFTNAFDEVSKRLQPATAATGA